MNRRHFLRTGATALGSSFLHGCATANSNSAATVIDPHTHFYDPTRPQGVPWPGRNDKILYRPVYPKDYRALQTPHRVAGTIVVEASPWIEDNQWILDLAANDPFILGFVGNLPAGKPEFARLLERFSANKLFRGIRIGARKLDDANLRDLKLLADRDLSLDLLGGKEILGFAAEISQRLPSLRIIIDHLAGVRIDGKTPPANWTEPMRALAPHKNIFFKISGLVENAVTVSHDVSYYTPVLNFMRDTFGPDRLMYASNWPVSERFAPLSVVQNLVEDYFASYSSRESHQVLAETSQIAYRWNPR